MSMKIDIKENENATFSKKIVGTQIPINLYDQLKTESENSFMSISDLLRKIIYLYYENKVERK